jgi:RNA polymerase sigma-B factor
MATKSSAIRSRGMELLMEYKQSPSVAIRNQLVRLNAGLVRKIAHRVSHQCSEPYEDLEQIGYIGLIRAIERFNPSQGCAFSSFAVPYIRGEMLHFLRDRGTAVKIPRRWQDLLKESQRLQLEMLRELKPRAQRQGNG